MDSLNACEKWCRYRQIYYYQYVREENKETKYQNFFFENIYFMVIKIVLLTNSIIYLTF